MVLIIHQVGYKLLCGVYLDGYICSTLHGVHSKSKFLSDGNAQAQLWQSHPLSSETLARKLSPYHPYCCG